MRRSPAILLLIALSACQPRPRREHDAGDASDTDAMITIDVTEAELGPTPDVALDEDGAIASSPQLPPIGHDALTVWLQTRVYRTWRCHVALQRARPAPTHSLMRVCINRAWESTAANAVFPAGAAAVQELYLADGVTVVGHAVMRKLGPTNIAQDWYWYEKLPAGTMNDTLPEAITAQGVVADHVGDRGNAQRVCASCHSIAGQAGTPGHHFVYTAAIAP